MQLAGATITLLVGAFFVLVAWGSVQHRRRRQATGIRVPGVIVGHQRKAYGVGADATPVLVPVVRFRAADGSVREFVHRAGTNVHKPRQGARVTIWYDPEDPAEHPVVEGDAAAGCLPWIFGVLGVATVLVSAGLLGAVLL